MKHSGKAFQAAGKILVWPTIALLAVILVDTLAWPQERIVIDVLAMLWAAFTVFTFYFFRDPEARVPDGPNLVVSPGHGKVDAIDETEETEFMSGQCKRISMFLSVIDVHVQNAPVEGRVKYVNHTPGKFLSAMGAESAVENENVLIGFMPAEHTRTRIGVRLIAGLIARRIIPWVSEGEDVARGERMSLIQFGSRVDVYLPMSATIKVKLGDKVVGGESVLATLA